MHEYVDPPSALPPPKGGTGRRSTAWTLGTGCALALASAWSLGTLLVVAWHPAPRREVLLSFAVTVLLGLAWLLASRLAPALEPAEPAPPRPRPTPAELRGIAARTARRSRRSVLTGWAMVLPAIWTVPVVFLTAHQPLERDLIARHTALVAAGARWTDNTVALSTAEAAGRPREHGRMIAVHPAGQPEVSLAVENERGKLDRFVAGDNLRILRDPEHPGLGMFPEPLLPLVHPGRPFANGTFVAVLVAVLVVWWCILIGVLGRRALLPTRWLRVDRYPLTADPPQPGPDGPEDTTRPPVDWQRVRIHGTVLQWRFRTGSSEDGDVTTRSGLRLDREAADPSPEPVPTSLAFEDHAERFAESEVTGRTAVRLAGAAGWLGRQRLGPGGSLAVLVLDNGETRWGLDHPLAPAGADVSSTGPADARPDTGPDTDAPTKPLRLPPLMQVFGLDERLGMSALGLYPMGAIWLNSTGVLRRFNGVGVFAVEVVVAVAWFAAGLGVAALVERRRARRRSAPTGAPTG
ncbi:hypothetical protein [Kitasatospora purpeofusca]|uniref:hypothetical protein n=1 Tax=Kitasatospora purpeofusca TaxID=67352 RepID=UPI00224F38DF|nr:hypothetical protein [Kitasatospora purpeofusca]MCX4755652.1 hypothetical protein [Kitasatospora purpeofusca]WSR36485.1 hypothetical protein OG715_39345 [Kitasatospora purpeofusca]